MQECNSDKPFQPLAQRQNLLGPYPIDPNLIAQGIPPDDRAGGDADLYGPLQGTPLPPDVGAPPSPASGATPVAPSSFGAGGPENGPSVVVAKYDPRTGQYVGPDGGVYQQRDLATAGTEKSWQDLLPT